MSNLVIPAKETLKRATVRMSETAAESLATSGCSRNESMSFRANTATDAGSGKKEDDIA